LRANRSSDKNEASALITLKKEVLELAKRKAIPKYGTVMLGGIEYYRTRIEDADGKRVALYGRTREELYDKVEEAKRQIEECSFRRETPTVKEYCEKWLLMQSAHVRATTLLDYTSKVKNYIINPLGHMYMADVTPDDVKLAVLPAAKKSESVYRSVNMLMKCIFYSAEDSHIIDENPTKKLSAKGGVPQKTKEALTDERSICCWIRLKGFRRMSLLCWGSTLAFAEKKSSPSSGTAFSSMLKRRTSR